MKRLLFLLLFLYPLISSAQTSGTTLDLKAPFKYCRINGSITLYDYKNQRWIYSDSVDAEKITLPASTFKVINLLIALETGVIKDENEVVNWVGKVDTVLYGYRPEIYRNMTVKEAFEQSAGWVFIELAKRIGRQSYLYYLSKSHYGNLNLSQKGADFWNFGNFGISPINQVSFLKNVYEEKLPFSKRSFEILKRIMVTEKTSDYTIRAKTGWTRDGGKDTGWWVGYLENKDNVYFFATRIIKDLKTKNPNFSNCRKEITKQVLRQLNAM